MHFPLWASKIFQIFKKRGEQLLYKLALDSVTAFLRNFPHAPHAFVLHADQHTTAVLLELYLRHTSCQTTFTVGTLLKVNPNCLTSARVGHLVPLSWCSLQRGFGSSPHRGRCSWWQCSQQPYSLRLLAAGWAWNTSVRFSKPLGICQTYFHWGQQQYYHCWW